MPKVKMTLRVLKSILTTQSRRTPVQGLVVVLTRTVPAVTVKCLVTVTPVEPPCPATTRR